MRLPILPALVAAAAACAAGPEAGDLTFDLATPNQDDGAIQFVITATPPEGVVTVRAACTGCRVFTAALNDTEIRGVLTGTVVPGAALSVTVTDMRKTELYAAQVVAVATRAYALRTAEGYALSIPQR
jgi:hypothetical protein